ncbi:MAG: Sec-independent protein translocase subunit TatA/TatB [Sphaerochaetaceae bacterium]
MFGFGITETITLVIVILVLINPKDLPVIVRKLGNIYARIVRQINILKKSYSDFEQEVDTVAKDLEIKDTRKRTVKRTKGVKL